MNRPTSSRIGPMAVALMLALALSLAGCAATDPTVTPVAGHAPTPGGSGGAVGPRITHVLKPTPVGAANQTPAIEVSYRLNDEVNHATNAFGLALLQRLADQDGSTNVMISPLSLAMALGMTANGAVGDTQSGMLATLELGDMEMQRANEGYAGLMQRYADRSLPATVAIANALWIDEGEQFHQEYLLDTARYYDAELTTLPMDDVAIERINTWVNEKTLGEIPAILAPPMNPDTVLLLTNAIYFKGKWRDPFDPDRTRERTFTLLDGSQTQAMVMPREAEMPIIAGGEGDAAYRVTALPYGDDGNLQMWLVLPDEDDGLPDVLAGLTADDFARWDAALADASRGDVYLALPKFESDYEVELNDILSEMGMAQAFTRDADFGGMSPQGDLFYISLVKHKSAVTVDEEGTVAAAATVVEVQKESVSEVEAFICDHPFLYVIWDGQADMALFVGLLMAP